MFALCAALLTNAFIYIFLQIVSFGRISEKCVSTLQETLFVQWAHSLLLCIVFLMTAQEVVMPWHKGSRCFCRELYETELLLVNTVDTEPSPGGELEARNSAGTAVLSIHGMHAYCACPHLCFSVCTRTHMCVCAYVCLCVSRLPVMDTDVSISSGPSDRSSILNQFGSGLRA